MRKTIIVVGMFLWMISALLVGIGITIFYGNGQDLSKISTDVINPFVILFALSFSMVTPIYFNLMFNDVMWKNQKEMDDLRKKHHESIRQYNEAVDKLINHIIN